MKEYFSIPYVVRKDVQIIAFDKIDGSNIRAEWSRKNGFYKFGSRRCLIDANHETLGEAVGLIRTKYEDALTRIFRDERYDRVICFFEFSGEHSFAGQHVDEPHEIVLLDVNPHKQGILDPRDLLKRYGHLDLPRQLHRGKANKEFEMSVRNGSLEGMTFEGVVCKGSNPKKPRHRIMFKIKNQAWFDRLRAFCDGDDILYNKLV